MPSGMADLVAPGFNPGEVGTTLKIRDKPDAENLTTTIPLHASGVFQARSIVECIGNEMLRSRYKACLVSTGVLYYIAKECERVPRFPIAV